LPPQIPYSLDSLEPRTNFPPPEAEGLPAINTHPRGTSMAAALRATNFYLATRSKTPNISQPLSKQSEYRPGVS